MEQVVKVARVLREEHDFRGYLHLKTIPEAAPELLARAGRYAARPRESTSSCRRSGTARTRAREGRRHDPALDGPAAIRTSTMRSDAADRMPTSQPMLPPSRAPAPRFAPAGPIDADHRRRRCGRRPHDPRHQRDAVRRVPAEARLLLGVQPHSRCGAGAAAEAPPMIREHRLYQADWLMRFYGYAADEIVDDTRPHAVARGRPEAGVGAGPPRALSGRPAQRAARDAAARAGSRRQGGARLLAGAPSPPHPGRRPEAPQRACCRRSCPSSSSPASTGARPRPRRSAASVDAAETGVAVRRPSAPPARRCSRHAHDRRRRPHDRAGQRHRSRRVPRGLPAARRRRRSRPTGSSGRPTMRRPASCSPIRSDDAAVAAPIDPPAASSEGQHGGGAGRLPDACESVILHRDPGRFELLYRLLWRLRSEPALRHDPLDADRIERRPDGPGGAPRHAQDEGLRSLPSDHRVARGAGPRGRRCRGRRCPRTKRRPARAGDSPRRMVRARAPRRRGGGAILRAPLRADALVDPDARTQRAMGRQARSNSAPAHAARTHRRPMPASALWLTYYESIFNPARLKLAMMQREMPRRYWRNLPEAQLISPLSAAAAQRSMDMIAKGPTTPSRRRPPIAAATEPNQPVPIFERPALAARSGAGARPLPRMPDRRAGHAGRARRRAEARAPDVRRRAAGRSGRPARAAVRRPGRPAARPRVPRARLAARRRLRDQCGQAFQVRAARQAPHPQDAGAAGGRGLPALARERDRAGRSRKRWSRSARPRRASHRPRRRGAAGARHAGSSAAMAGAC